MEIKETIGELEVSLRKNLWDEENRLTAVNLKPDSNTQHPIGVYTYDAGGERIIKRNLNRLKIRSNAKEQEDVEEDNVMLYPSGLIIAKPDNKSKRNRPSVSYTKHYYVGSERVASKIGTTDELGGIPNVINTVIPNLNIEEIHYWSTTRLIEAGAALQSVYNTFNLQPPTFNPLTQYYGVRFFHTGDLEVFYFHPDHLGSSSYITNLDGNVTQHMEYLPFGETLVDEHTNSNNSPFKFNGKELDEETGNYYYGARYYNPKWSIWLSVDPLAEQTPSWSPYVYTHNNPLRYTDPSGMSADDVIIKGKEAQAGFDQLQNSVQGELSLSMNDNGKVTYKQNGEGKLSGDAQQLANAIDDHSVMVNVTAENTKETSTGNLYIGGALMGNGVTDEKYQGKNIVQASQEVNPKVLKRFSEANNKAGKGMLHEVTEGYQGGLISQGTGISSPRAGLPGSVYSQAHSAATKQPGTVNRRLFNKDGLITTPLYLGNKEFFILPPVKADYISKGQTIMSYP